MSAGQDHFFTVAVPVSRPDASLKVMVVPLTVRVPVMRPDASRLVVSPEEDVDALELIRH